MTTLAITPNWKNKTAKFKGTVAAGEHVSVTIQNENGEGEPFIGDASTLRLRVVNPCNGRTLAIFPEPVPEGETPEEWDSDLSPLRSTLNLNTVQMLKAVSPAANVPLLFVLDDYENKTLYFKEQFHVEHWPRQRGEEEPTDLDNYKDLIAEFNARLDGFGSRITDAEAVANAATTNASAAVARANDAKTIANNAVGVAQQAKEAAETSQESAAASATAAQNAANAAIAAAESINNPDVTLAQEGVAADAKATGERIAAERTRAEAAEAAEESRAKAAESALAANVSSAQKAISDEAELRAAADADLEANKADKTAVAAEENRALAAERDLRADVTSAQTAIANRYTKSEVDAKVAGVQTFQKLIVNELPSAEAADDKTIYLVPRTGSETPDLCDEYVTVGAAGSRRWEKIGGGTAVDVTLDDAVTRTSAKGVKSSGIWAAIWGALSALPLGFTSLYDWVVARLSGKRGNMDMAVYSYAPWTDGMGQMVWDDSVGRWIGAGSSSMTSGYQLRYANGTWTLTYGIDYNPYSVAAPEDVLSLTFPNLVTYTRMSVYVATPDALAKASQLDGKLDKSGGMVTGELGVGAGPLPNFQVVPARNEGDYIPPTMRFGDGASVVGIVWRIVDGGVVMDVTDLLGSTYRIAWPSASGTLALKGNIPYSLAAPIVIDTASSETVGGETVYYGAATLADRTANIVQVTAATALDELRITFPAATNGKVRDFGLRVEIGTGSAALAAPALVPIAPTGETIKLENNAAEIPALADGTATAKGVTLLYFSETAPGVFVVKGEQIEEVL